MEPIETDRSNKNSGVMPHNLNPNQVPDQENINKENDPMADDIHKTPNP